MGAEVEREVLEFIYLAEDRGQWRAVANKSIFGPTGNVDCIELI
jgi:hypothetical protein